MLAMLLLPQSLDSINRGSPSLMIYTFDWHVQTIWVSCRLPVLGRHSWQKSSSFSYSILSGDQQVTNMKVVFVSPACHGLT